MRYYQERLEEYTLIHGEMYTCNHPIYNTCTLYLQENRGLAVVQQRFNPNTKTTYWSFIDPWLNDLIYRNQRFQLYFNKYALEPSYELYPTVTVRQIMWGLKMKPLEKELWETTFDHCPL